MFSRSPCVALLKEVSSKVDSLDDLAFFAAGGTPFTRRRDGPIRRDRKAVLLSRSLSCANAGKDLQRFRENKSDFKCIEAS